MDITRRTALDLTAAAALLTGGCIHEPSLAPGFDGPRPNMEVWRRSPARRWVEALPVGNGRIGAMVFGGVAMERIQLNEDTLWCGGPHDPANPEAKAALPEVRRLVFEGEYRAATRLVADKVMAKPLRQMSYQSIGDLRIAFPGNGSASAYRHSLDLDGGVVTTRFRTGDVQWTREVFASAVDQTIIVRMTVDQPGRLDADIAFRWPDLPPPAAVLDDPAYAMPFEQASERPADLVTEMSREGDLVMRGRNAGQHGVPGALTWEARARIATTGGEARFIGDRLSVRGANEVMIRIALATSYRNFQTVDGDPVAQNRATLAAADRKTHVRQLSDHRADVQTMMRRVSLDLGRTPAADLPTDERVMGVAGDDDPALAALYFQFGRYLLMSCSRAGSQAANLQGLWNELQNPPWGSKYTININTQMNYWPAEPTQLAECVRPLTELVKDLSVTGARTATTMYGARGWVAHHNTDLWRGTAPVDGAVFGMWPTGGAWLCLHLWDRWDYSRDPAVLREIYPILKGAAIFFLDTLQPHPNGRWLVTNPSMSPENMHQPGASIACGPAMDNQILRDLFANTAQAAGLLGLDAEFRAQILAARERLPPDRIGAQGQLQEWLDDWDATAVDVHHRHVSHLYGVYPSGQINPDSTPALAEAAKRALDLRGDEATGWGIGWRLNLWARLRDAERAHAILKLLLGSERTYPNLFDAHPPFQIDGNFGGVSGMAEMLMQSVKGQGGEDHVLLLPALPRAWASGEVTGLRARGGLEVDVRWRDGGLDAATLTALRSGRWTISYKSASLDLSLAAGQPVTIQMQAEKLTALAVR